MCLVGYKDGQIGPYSACSRDAEAEDKRGTEKGVNKVFSV